ncbi:MAG TPA: UDP-N-acetylglucosamine 1-carboxyvinyltransferase [Sphingobacterium bovisgrunnientis]|nr:UDP-N-acetylglucosamine 1-carboxyvinyltransferase [Sphingobacterium bovisgrunnientis]
MKINSNGVSPKGEVVVSGAKNSATRLMAASLLTDEKVILSNFPTELVDAREKAKFFLENGVQVNFKPEEDVMEIVASDLEVKENFNTNVPVRTTYLLAAGQLLRHGKAYIPYPGGCKIGDRKYDLHIMVWETLGCQVIERASFIEIIKPKDGLIAQNINFPISTVGGTENAILSCLVAKGISVIKNAYVTPEVYDLILMLRQMGAKIELEGKSYIKIEGGHELRGVNYAVMPDRIEAITWIVYAILSGGDVLIKNVPLDEMEIPLIHLKECGVNLYLGKNSIFVSKDSVGEYGIQPFELACGTHPGIISDMQPFYVLLALMANGRSKVFDYRYPKRMAYLDELNKYCDGAISYKEGEITIVGPVEFKNANGVGLDLRGSMAIILAALLAKGESNVENPEMALRGYNKLLEKLHLLGVEVN